MHRHGFEMFGNRRNRRTTMRRTIQMLGAVAAVAAAIMVPALARGACGDGVLDAGEDCDPGAAACTYLSAAPDAPVIDCRNALCTEKDTGINVVCTDRCLLTPACRPLLDDPARITFRARPKLDLLSVTGRSVPLTTLDPVTEEVSFSLQNVNGQVYAATIPATSFIPNTKLTAWKYVLKRTGLPLLYNFRIRKRLNRTTGATEFILKAKAESNLDVSNPVVMGQTVEELKNMTLQISIGDDVFYNTADWEVKGNGWYLADKYMFL
jgi:hypothetical protein